MSKNFDSPIELGFCGHRPEGEGIMRNEAYTPYQSRSSDWYYDDQYGRSHGPFVSEQYCQREAEVRRERDGVEE